MDDLNQNFMGLDPNNRSSGEFSPENAPSKKKMLIGIIGSMLTLALVAAGYFAFFHDSVERPPSLEFSGNQGFIAGSGDYGFSFESSDVMAARTMGESDAHEAGSIPYFYSESDITMLDIVASIDPRDGNSATSDLMAQIGLYDNSLKKFPLYPAGIFKGSSAAHELSKRDLDSYKIPAYTPFFIFTNKDFGTWDLKTVDMAPSNNSIDIDSLEPGWYMMVFEDDMDLRETFYSCPNGIESIWTYRGPDSDIGKEFGENPIDLSDVEDIKLSGDFKLAWIHKNIETADTCRATSVPGTTTDTDFDQVLDSEDNCPAIANNSQDDSDNDGVGDKCDNCPNDSNADQADSDSNGVGDVCEASYQSQTTADDTDGDGVADDVDAFPNDATESVDTDGDGVGDNADAFPNDDTETLDTDGDGVGDNADAFPNDDTETLDTDGDGVGDNADNCNDTLSGVVVDENGCEVVENPDTDGDGINDDIDTDDDDDGIEDDLDACPLDPAVIDDDGDGCDDCLDQESVFTTPKCLDPVLGTGYKVMITDLPALASDKARVAVILKDMFGADIESSKLSEFLASGMSACIDVDTSNQDDVLKGFSALVDLGTKPELTALGSCLESDDDNDSVLNGADNCPSVQNTNQENFDGDLMGDACDDDIDGDTVLNADDKCEETNIALDVDVDGCPLCLESYIASKDCFSNLFDENSFYNISLKNPSGHIDEVSPYLTEVGHNDTAQKQFFAGETALCIENAEVVAKIFEYLLASGNLPVLEAKSTCSACDLDQIDTLECLDPSLNHLLVIEGDPIASFTKNVSETEMFTKLANIDPEQFAKEVDAGSFSKHCISANASEIFELLTKMQVEFYFAQDECLETTTSSGGVPVSSGIRLVR